MKRMGVLLALVLVLTAGIAFAHDKGDFMLNIEPQVGLAFPHLPLMAETGMLPGFDFAVRETFHYYFVDFFAINAGLGYGFNFHLFAGDGGGYFFGSYFSIPVGVRFSLSAFTIGGGVVGNLPVYVFGRYEYDDGEFFYGGYAKDENITFKGKPHMGWYVDIGFDLSGRKGRKGGFGMFGRLGGSLVEEVATPSSSQFRNFEPYGFRFVSLSLVFQAAIQLASLPIGKSKKVDAE